MVHTEFITCIIFSFALHSLLLKLLKFIQVNSGRDECLSGEEQLRYCPSATVAQIFVAARECAFATRQYDYPAWWFDKTTICYTRSCLHFIYQCPWFDLMVISATCVVIASACNFCYLVFAYWFWVWSAVIWSLAFVTFEGPYCKKRETKDLYPVMFWS